MKYRYIVSIILVLFMLLIGCTKYQKTENEERKSTKNDAENNMKHTSVYVNGQHIKEITAIVSSTGVRLPFIQIARSLGMNIDVENDEIAHIDYNNSIYKLQCYPEVILVKQGKDGENLLIPPPGATSYYCQREFNDVFLDSETFASALSLMGIVIHIDVDYDNSIVTITEKTEDLS